MPHTSLHHQYHDVPNGRVHLSAQAFRIDPATCRHQHTLGWHIVDVSFRFILPVVVLLVIVGAWLGLIWLVLAIGRAVSV